MAEEHGFQSPEGGHRPCANNCGFLGSPATGNFCSKCYRDILLKEDREKLQKNDHSSFGPRPSPLVSSPDVSVSPAVISLGRGEAVAESAAIERASEQPSRCSACRRKVGLTGFGCRCGATFCGTHRYPEKHECTFDYKAVGREAIAKANPVVVADKLVRI